MTSYYKLPDLPRRSLLACISAAMCLIGAAKHQTIRENLSAGERNCSTIIKDCRTELGYKLDHYKYPDDVFICDWYGHFLRRRGRFREAEEIYLSVINLRKKRCERNCLIVLPMQGLALVYQDQGRFAEAEKLLVEGMQIRQKLDSEESLGLAESQNYLGWLYRRQSQNAKAEIYFKASLTSSIKASGKESLAAVSSMLELCDFYLANHDSEKASFLYKEVLKIQKNKLTADDVLIRKSH